MKKIILIALIFPLIVLARPERKILGRHLSGHWASIVWDGTALGDDNCAPPYTITTSPTNIADDDDCDDVPRICYGQFNSTDCTCSDGAAGGCDGVKLGRLKVSYIPAGIFYCLTNSRTYFPSGRHVAHFMYDGSTYSYTNLKYDSGSSANATTWHAWFYYDVPQYNKTFDVMFTSDVNATTTTYVRNTQNSDFQVHCFHYPDSKYNKEIYFK